MARPTKLTPSVQDAIAKALQVGATWKMAAAAAGVSPAVVLDWKRLGRDGKAPYAEFLRVCTVSEAKGGMAALSRVVKAAQGGDRRAAQYLLDRRYRYGSRDPEDLPDEPVDGVAGMLASARRMRRAAEADGSYVAAASLLATEQKLLEQLAEAEAKKAAEAATAIPTDQLLAELSEAIESLDEPDRIALLARMTR